MKVGNEATSCDSCSSSARSSAPHSCNNGSNEEVIEQNIHDILDQNYAFDLHTHPGAFQKRGLSPTYGGDEDVLRAVSEMIAGHMSGGFFSFIGDGKILEIGPGGPKAIREYEEGEAWAEYKRQLNELKNLMEIIPAKIATNVSDFEPNQKAGLVSAFINCEGGDFIEGKPEHLAEMYADGVRSFQIVHYAQNDLGDLQTLAPRYSGLSEIGKEVVKEANRLGMLIDVAHASFDTCRDVVESSDSPIMLSHSHLKWGEKQHARLLTKDHARLIAESGGIIGMWPSGFANKTFADFVDNTLRLVEHVGVDHVGLGTDMDGNYEPVFDSYLQMPEWIDALMKKGLSAEEAGKIAGGNAIRVIREVIE